MKQKTEKKINWLLICLKILLFEKIGIYKSFANLIKGGKREREKEKVYTKLEIMKNKHLNKFKKCYESTLQIFVDINLKPRRSE